MQYGTNAVAVLDEQLVVIWDSTTGVPVKTIFDPHPNGIIAMDFSYDATYLITLSGVS